MITRTTPIQIKPGVLGLDLRDIGTLIGVALHAPSSTNTVTVALDWDKDGSAHPVQVDDLIILCPTCRDAEQGSLTPRHKAALNCESGGREHCSCDICF